MGFETDLAARGCELNGVVEQAFQHLGERDRVGRDGEIGRCDRYGESLLPYGRPMLLGGGADGEQAGQIAWLGLDLAAAGEQVGVAEYRVDNVEQPLTAFRD